MRRSLEYNSESALFHAFCFYPSNFYNILGNDYNFLFIKCTKIPLVVLNFGVSGQSIVVAWNVGDKKHNTLFQNSRSCMTINEMFSRSRETKYTGSWLCNHFLRIRTLNSRYEKQQIISSDTTKNIYIWKRVGIHSNQLSARFVTLLTLHQVSK